MPIDPGYQDLYSLFVVYDWVLFAKRNVTKVSANDSLWSVKCVIVWIEIKQVGLSDHTAARRITLYRC